MGFEDEMVLASPYFEKGDNAFQIDLIYERLDKVITLCEIKHLSARIGTKVIPEVEQKCRLIELPKGIPVRRP